MTSTITYNRRIAAIIANPASLQVYFCGLYVWSYLQGDAWLGFTAHALYVVFSGFDFAGLEYVYKNLRKALTRSV